MLMFAATSTCSAFADDHAQSASWSGFYIGANGGYGFSDGESSEITVFNPAGIALPTTSPLRYGLEPEGGFGGGQVGYNHQFGALVVGVEADIQASDINDDSRTTFVNPGDPNVISPFDYNASIDIDWFGTVRGRLGYAYDRTLLYLTGGYAYGEVSYSALYDFPPPGPGQSFGTAKFSDRKDGYVLGAGVEHEFCENISLKVEYQYIDLGDHDVSGELFFRDGRASGETFRSEVDVDFHTVRVGLNYKFGDRREPAAPLK